MLHYNRLIKTMMLTTAVFLNSCSLIQTKEAAAPKPTESAAVLHQKHMQSIDQIDTFTIKGRLAVITQPKNHSARLKWQHDTASDHIDIYTPLGGKVAEIEKTATSVTLTDNKNNALSASDVESLTEKALGFRLPLSGLKNWALGRPHDKGLAEAMTWDVYGHVNTLQQNGWQIQYKNYTKQDSYFLPKKVFMKNDKLTIKLIIDEWINLPQQSL